MKYLITGGTGLIGQALIIKLLQDNVDISVLTRNVAKAKDKLPNNVSFITRLSLDDIESSDIIINLAGEPIAGKRWSSAQKSLICHSRWGITRELVSNIVLAKKPPTLLISGSAIGIYGRQSSEPISESFTDFKVEFTNTVCEKWENIANRAASNKTRVALLRTGVVLAKESGALKELLMPFKLGVGGKIGQGNQVMSWIHIEDMVNAIIHIINNEKLSGPINITAENAVSNKEFSIALAAELNRPCFITTPEFIMKTIFGEMSDLLIYGQNVYPDKLMKSKFYFQYNDINKALNHLLKR
jgi:uncharacterized protein (TIGR01777 family)